MKSRTYSEDDNVDFTVDIETLNPSEYIDTISIKKEDKIRAIDVHKFRYSLAKIILIGFFSIFILSLFASTIGLCRVKEYASLLEKLIPILALIIGFYFGKERR